MSLSSNQQEEDLRENHPYFDTPLFTIARESNFRKFCQLVVEARYNIKTKDHLGQESNINRYKQGQYVIVNVDGNIHRFEMHRKFSFLFSSLSASKFLGLVTYLDWIMIVVTIISAVSMSFETPINRVVDQPLLQV
jgi:sodium leak channel non-selective protein